MFGTIFLCNSHYAVSITLSLTDFFFLAHQLVENVLAKEDCEGLMSLIDHGLFPNVEVPEYQDIQKYIDESDLVSVIGKVRIIMASFLNVQNNKSYFAYIPIEL